MAQQETLAELMIPPESSEEQPELLAVLFRDF
jgi:hypothetical protein